MSDRETRIRQQRWDELTTSLTKIHSYVQNIYDRVHAIDDRLKAIEDQFVIEKKEQFEDYNNRSYVPPAREVNDTGDYEEGLGNVLKDYGAGSVMDAVKKVKK